MTTGGSCVLNAQRTHGDMCRDVSTVDADQNNVDVTRDTDDA